MILAHIVRQRLAPAILGMTGVLLVAGCQKTTVTKVLSINATTGPTDTILLIGRAAQACWFKTKDPAFAGYRMADEVNSHSGRPRLLLVPKNDPSGLPALVVQAEKGGSTAPGAGAISDVQAFGPLLSSPQSDRISADIKRWATGDKACS